MHGPLHGALSISCWSSYKQGKAKLRVLQRRLCWSSAKLVRGFAWLCCLCHLLLSFWADLFLLPVSWHCDSVVFLSVQLLRDYPRAWDSFRTSIFSCWLLLCLPALFFAQLHRAFPRSWNVSNTSIFTAGFHLSACTLFGTAAQGYPLWLSCIREEHSVLEAVRVRCEHARTGEG